MRFWRAAESVGTDERLPDGVPRSSLARISCWCESCWAQDNDKIVNRFELAPLPVPLSNCADANGSQNYSSETSVASKVINGADPSLNKATLVCRACSRVHRLQRRSKIASTRSSQNLGPDWDETAPKTRIRIGAKTDAPKPLGFVRVGGPTEVSCARPTEVA